MTQVRVEVAKLHVERSTYERADALRRALRERGMNRTGETMYDDHTRRWTLSSSIA
jgi:hypothetical protein